MNIAENLRNCYVDECDGCNIGLESARCYGHLMILAAKRIEEMEFALNGHCWACKHGQQENDNSPFLMRCRYLAERASKIMRTKNTGCEHWEFAAGKFGEERKNNE